MLWQGRRGSSNVEDRRGVSGGQVAVGGGILGVIALVLNFLLGGDPSQLPQQLPTQNRELTAEEKAWFRQLADHELAESKLMQEGMPYRDIRSFVEGEGFTKNPPGAHDKAPLPPGDFPGFIPKIF